MLPKVFWAASAKFGASLEQELTGRTPSILLQAAEKYHPIVSGQEEDDKGYYYELTIHFDNEPSLSEITEIFTSIADLRLLPLRDGSIEIHKHKPDPNLIEILESSSDSNPERMLLSLIPPQLLIVVNKVIDEICSQGDVRSTDWNFEGCRMLENFEFYFDSHDDGGVMLNIKSLTSSVFAGIPASNLNEEGLWSTLQLIFYPEH